MSVEFSQTLPSLEGSSGKLDQFGDNVKEKAGELLDDPKLEAEGVIQQGIGKVKEVAADIEEKASDVLKKGKEEAEHLVDEAKEKAENLIDNIKSKF